MGFDCIAPMKDCKICAGTGWDVQARGIFVCDVCAGHGWVPLEICRGCGLPAFEQTSAPVPYCGSEVCLRKLLNVVDFSKPPVKALVVMPRRAAPLVRAADMIGRRRLHEISDTEFNAAIERWQRMSGEYPDCRAGIGYDGWDS